MVNQYDKMAALALQSGDPEVFRSMTLASEDRRKAKFIAFYLPQFHPTPENDEWWGPGFTEWTNVAKARRLFAGHRQPLLPGQLGFYDLRLPETRELQAAIARKHGIAGFCYWHYWFGNGKRILDRPFAEVLASGKPDFPFCLAWANHTWAGHWIGAPDKVMVKQEYPGRDDWVLHFNNLRSAFEDPRYMTVDGKPIFVVYRAAHLPDTQAFMETWRELGARAGLPGFYFVGLRPIHDKVAAWMNLYDATVLIRPTFRDRYIPRIVLSYRFGIGLPNLQSYKAATRSARRKDLRYKSDLPCIFPNWDNTPRSGLRGHVYLGTSPAAFAEQISDAWDIIRDRPEPERIVFVRSWNEWAEGNILEPDRRNGMAYLEEIKKFIDGEVRNLQTESSGVSF